MIVQHVPSLVVFEVENSPAFFPHTEQKKIGEVSPPFPKEVYTTINSHEAPDFFRGVQAHADHH